MRVERTRGTHTEDRDLSSTSLDTRPTFPSASHTAGASASDFATASLATSSLSSDDSCAEPSGLRALRMEGSQSWNDWVKRRSASSTTCEQRFDGDHQHRLWRCLTKKKGRTNEEAKML